MSTKVSRFTKTSSRKRVVKAAVPETREPNVSIPEMNPQTKSNTPSNDESTELAMSGSTGRRGVNLNILNEILHLTSAGSVKVYAKRGGDDKDSMPDTLQYILVINAANNVYMLVSNQLYKPTSANMFNVLQLYNANSYNVYLYTDFKASIVRMLDKKYFQSTNEELTRQIALALNNISGSVVGDVILGDISEELSTFYWSYMCSRNIGYAARPKRISYPSIRIYPKYNIVRIPRELQQLIVHMYDRFDELKGMLHMNKDTGYYSVTVRDIANPNIKTEVDVICRHQYMQLMGIDKQTIAIECFRAGRCKYCNEDLPPAATADEMELPSKVYSLMYGFIECVKTQINANVMINQLVKAFSACVQDLQNSLANEDNMLAMAAIFLFKVYSVCFEKALLDFSKTKLSTYLTLLDSKMSILGVNRKNVFTQIDQSIFSSMSVENLVHDSINKPANFDDSFLYNVLYSDSSKKVIQDAFEKGTIPSLNASVYAKYCALWKFKTTLINSKNVNTAYKPKLSNDKSEEYLKHFFESTCDYFCPVHLMHEYNSTHEGGKICIYCGLAKDGSNERDILKKVMLTLTTSFTIDETRNANSFSVKGDDVNEIVGKLGKMNPDELLTRHVTLGSFEINKIIMDRIKEKVHPSVRNLVNSLLKFELSKAANVKQDSNEECTYYINALSYIVENDLCKASLVYETLCQAYAPIKNIMIL